ncbi:metal-dependent hydrolase [Euzebya rosea]|uniref:metal-dependent hydrolase n=1 Tax=Euzebya rosea TaxID=2052804 RepID=UPI000D3E2AF0|nr:metal-dependent hydrolase [Euzebya rosea]
MQAKGHALSGAATFLAVAPTLSIPPAAVLVGTLLCAGAATAPDLDHPGSTITRTGGLATRAVGVAIRALAGGHRQATHSLLFVAAAASAVHLFVVGPPAVVPAAAIVGGLVAVAGPLLAASFGGRVSLLGFVVAAAGCAGLVLGGRVPINDWFTVAVAGGLLVHVVGDMLTPEGVPLLWPWRRRFGVGLFRTAGIAEQVVTVALALATFGLAVRALLWAHGVDVAGPG